MRIAFLDATGFGYTVDTMLMGPLGGSQTALSDLAKLLAKRGHDVTLYNKSDGCNICHIVGGVRHRPIQTIEDKRSDLNHFDVVVVLNGAIGRWLRYTLGVTVPLVLWCHHDYNQPAIYDLADPAERSAWTRIAFVGFLQRQRVSNHYGLSPYLTKVMPNCVPLVFDGLDITEPSKPLILVYLSTPFRGLDILLDVFPAIRHAISGTTLRVYSSMAPYYVPAQDDDKEFGRLYAQAKATEGVEYRGSVGLNDLISELPGVTALAHPSTFPEVQSIAALEAMAVGAAVLTTDLGGQREVTGGLATMIPYDADHKRLGESFTAMVIKTLQNIAHDPERERHARGKRAAYVRDVCNWNTRALEWETWLGNIISTI